jgi:hypothetical protein
MNTTESTDSIEKYDSTFDTAVHQNRVSFLMHKLIHELHERAMIHDASKLQPPEKEVFDRVTPLLKGLTYGSDEYKKTLRDMGVALQHHYQVNRHHPEHFSDGIAGMNLVDIMEMICDWVAASERHADGDIWESITRNANRFGYDGNMIAILENTVRRLI